MSQKILGILKELKVRFIGRTKLRNMCQEREDGKTSK